MPKSFILLLCIALASVVVFNLNSNDDDRDEVVVDNDATPPAPAWIEATEEIPEFDLWRLVDSPTDADGWYLVRANGACNNYSTDPRTHVLAGSSSPAPPES